MITAMYFASTRINWVVVVVGTGSRSWRVLGNCSNEAVDRG